MGVGETSVGLGPGASPELHRERQSCPLPGEDLTNEKEGPVIQEQWRGEASSLPVVYSHRVSHMYHTEGKQVHMATLKSYKLLYEKHPVKNLVLLFIPLSMANITK